MRLVSFFAAASLLALGCASPTSADATTSTSNVETADATDAILVQQAQHLTSQKLGADGSVIATNVDDYSLLAGDKVLTAKHELATGDYECTFFPGDAPQKGDYRADALSLGETVLVPAAPKEDSDFGLDEHATITGNLGPYVFVRTDVYFNGCGAAHPSYSASAFVWDAKNGKQITFTPPDAAAKKARAELKGKGFDGEDVKLVEVIPRFDAQGHFSLAWRFEKGASHAEADGKGTDYTISAFIESKDLDLPLPPELDALKDPPASVAAYLSQNPTTNPIIGWSRAD